MLSHPAQLSSRLHPAGPPECSTCCCARKTRKVKNKAIILSSLMGRHVARRH
jgi:hypothetical protein